MSRKDLEVPERLRAWGAENLERRLIAAAGREEPSPELSSRMAQAIGVSMPAESGPGARQADTGAAAPQATAASGSLLPWVAGALATAAVAAGLVFATRPGAAPAPASPFVEPAPTSAPAVAPATPSAAGPLPSRGTPEKTAEPGSPTTPLPPSAQRSGSKPTGELSDQIALVDAARSAVKTGNVERALAAVRKYQTQYPSGAFRPEAAALKIEALVNAGRTAEARAAAERFVVAYGPGPLADRVALLAGLTKP